MSKPKHTEEFDFTATGAGFDLAGRIALTGDTPPPPTLVLNPPTLPAGKVGDPYSAQLVATGGRRGRNELQDRLVRLSEENARLRAARALAEFDRRFPQQETRERP